MNTVNGRISMNVRSVKPLYSITPFTLLDYPDKTACILWFAGCNMRCLYCYNTEIVLGKGRLSFEDAFQFLASRRGLLDGVVLSGGECTMHKGLFPFIEKIKGMGFSVKIDTNGSDPVLLRQLTQGQLADYIALDFKALQAGFWEVTRSDLFLKFEESLLHLISSGVAFEVRTTVHSGLIPEKDFVAMVHYLQSVNYRGNYYVQHFMNGVPTLGELEPAYRELGRKDLSVPGVNVVYR
ncbi:MAG TPA: anaerobic ribonucleoside-triphosphate reductase activating protein [Chitinophaga sp.]|nr:anaerobic ribonucleoside-triphosphate reductase activating protein [Chitinophaga sp.]